MDTGTDRDASKHVGPNLAHDVTNRLLPKSEALAGQHELHLRSALIAQFGIV